MLNKKNFNKLVKYKLKNKKNFISLGSNTSADIEKKLSDNFFLIKNTFRYENSRIQENIINFLSKKK